MKKLESTMTIQKLHKPEHVDAEFVIVIDVIRAFTTAAHAFDRGAEKSYWRNAFNPDCLFLSVIKG